MNRNLLFVVTGLDVGGAEKHLAQIVPLLKSAGYRPLVYSLALGGVYQRVLEQAGIDVVGVPWGDGFFAVRSRPLKLPVDFVRLWWCLLRHRPAIVHFFLPKAYLLGALCHWAAGGKCIAVMSRRSLNDYQRSKPVWAALERFLHPRMRRVLANSKAVSRQLLAEGVAPEQLRLVYNGIEPHGDGETRADMRRRLGVTPETLLLVMVANLIPYKGHTDLLQALHFVRERLPADWVLLLAGRDEGVWEAFYAQAREWGLAEHIRWLGVTEHAGRLFRAADVGILCSHQEGFSNSLLEGMAEATPMVATDVGGNAEAVVDGETGWIVPPRDPQRLGVAILNLASDAALRDKMGSAARLRAEAEFSVAACVRQYDRIYSELLPS